MWNVSSRTSNTAKQDDISMILSGLILPIGMWKLQSRNWLKLAHERHALRIRLHVCSTCHCACCIPLHHLLLKQFGDICTMRCVNLLYEMWQVIGPKP